MNLGHIWYLWLKITDMIDQLGIFFQTNKQPEAKKKITGSSDFTASGANDQFCEVIMQSAFLFLKKNADKNNSY